MIFNSYSQAEEAAKKASIENPGFGWHVNWIEDEKWRISIFEDYPDQDYWMNGQKIAPEYVDD